MKPKLKPEIVSTRLNLGCGPKRLEGALNVDVAEGAAADLCFDLNARPWPLPRNHFTEIQARDVLEHLESIPSVLEELHEVCADGARIHLTVPHFSSANAFTDPTHRHFFGASSFDYFTASHGLNFYSKARFSIASRTIYFQPTLLNKIVWRLANRFPAEYERRWAWIFPAWFLDVELRAVKS